MFFNNGDFLVLRFDEGFMFCRIIDSELKNYYNYVFGNINAGSATDEIIPKEGENEIIYTETERTFVHFYPVIKPDRAELFVRIPYGTSPPMAPEKLNPPAPKTKYGFISGRTPKVDFIIPAKVSVGFEVYNPLDETINATMDIYQKYYYVQILRPEKHMNIIKKIVNYEFEPERIHFKTVGTYDDPINYRNIRNYYDNVRLLRYEEVFL